MLSAICLCPSRVFAGRSLLPPALPCDSDSVPAWRASRCEGRGLCEVQGPFRLVSPRWIGLARTSPGSTGCPALLAASAGKVRSSAQETPPRPPPRPLAAVGRTHAHWEGDGHLAQGWALVGSFPSATIAASSSFTRGAERVTVSLTYPDFVPFCL